MNSEEKMEIVHELEKGNFSRYITKNDSIGIK